MRVQAEAGAAPRVLVTLQKELFRDRSSVEYPANESATEFRIEVRSGEGIEPSGGGWSGPHSCRGDGNYPHQKHLAKKHRRADYI